MTRAALALGVLQPSLSSRQSGRRRRHDIVRCTATRGGGGDKNGRTVTPPSPTRILFRRRSSFPTMISPRSFEGTSSGGNGEYVNDDETNANDEGGGMLWCIKKCIGWVEKQVQNAKNAAPLLKWPDAVLLSKQTGRDVCGNAMVILVGLCVFTAMLGCIDWCIVAFRSWLLLP
ncbi:unnamed protein product [Bathycoccus prasinos]